MPDAIPLFAWQHIIFCNAALGRPVQRKVAGNRRALRMAQFGRWFAYPFVRLLLLVLNRFFQTGFWFENMIYCQS